MELEIIALVILMSLAGAGAGTFTGLVPGIHVNTLASLMLVAYPAIESAISGFTDPTYAPILVSSCIMSASVVHSFVDFVPSVFLGAPDPDEVLTALPGHRLLMEGKGMTAVRAAAVGSAVGASIAAVLAVPVQYLMLNGLGDVLDRFTIGILLFTLCVIVINEAGNTRKIWSVVLIAVSGTLGAICMHTGLPASGIIGEGTLLFPMLTGLFGMPSMLSSIGNVSVPEQRDDYGEDVGIHPGIKGTIVGCIAGWYPGITATAGASLASAFLPEREPARFISLVASLGTVTSVFSIVTLSVSGSGRSGTVLVIKDILGESVSGFCSDQFLILIFSVAVAAFAGYHITIASGRVLSNIAGRFDMPKINKVIIVLVSAMVLLLTGPVGILILIISTLIGLIPMELDMDRIPLTGCLIVPVVLTGLSSLMPYGLL